MFCACVFARAQNATAPVVYLACRAPVADVAFAHIIALTERCEVNLG